MRISIVDSCRSGKVYPLEITWPALCERLSHTVYTSETVSEYKLLPAEEQTRIKDVGGFLAGASVDGTRRRGSITDLCMLMLDADHATPGLLSQIRLLFAYECFIYTTHKSTPEAPRYRILVPLLLPVTPQQYPFLIRAAMADIGTDYFDPTCEQPCRLMFYPSTPKDGIFVAEHIDGAVMDPILYFQNHKDIADSIPDKKQSDNAVTMKPAEKQGVIGAFCRAYSVTEAIRHFLPDVYIRSSYDENRYKYSGASGPPGALVYDDMYIYSHHSTDPAHGHSCNAYDLVRIHLFSKLDNEGNSIKSTAAMHSFALADPAVQKQLVEDYFPGKDKNGY